MRLTAYIIAGSSLALAACAGNKEIITERVPVEVRLPVATGCISESGRPDPVVPLNERMSADQWEALAPGAKARAVEAQSGRRMNNADEDRAATAACE